MSVALWVVNILLALAFLAAGAMKLARPRQALIGSGMAWAADFSDPMVKTIGAVEVVGAVGLIVPILTGIAPVLTPLAAVGLAVIMAGAVIVHVRRKETPLPAAVLGCLAVVSAILGFATL